MITPNLLKGLDKRQDKWKGQQCGGSRWIWEENCFLDFIFWVLLENCSNSKLLSDFSVSYLWTEHQYQLFNLLLTIRGSTTYNSSIISDILYSVFTNSNIRDLWALLQHAVFHFSFSCLWCLFLCLFYNFGLWAHVSLSTGGGGTFQKEL